MARRFRGFRLRPAVSGSPAARRSGGAACGTPLRPMRAARRFGPTPAARFFGALFCGTPCGKRRLRHGVSAPLPCGTRVGSVACDTAFRGRHFQSARRARRLPRSEQPSVSRPPLRPTRLRSLTSHRPSPSRLAPRALTPTARFPRFHPHPGRPSLPLSHSPERPGPAAREFPLGARRKEPFDSINVYVSCVSRLRRTLRSDGAATRDRTGRRRPGSEADDPAALTASRLVRERAPNWPGPTGLWGTT